MKRSLRIFPGLKPVYEVVQSMTKAEKIRFKESAKGQNGKVPEDENDIAYVRFFNVIDDSRVYDKARIKEQLKGTNLLKDFSASCGYLYLAVVRAIQTSNNGTISEISACISQIRVLLYKGLHHHISPIYKQATEFAYETEDFESLIKLIRLRKVSLYRGSINGEHASELQLVLELENETWGKMANLREWENLYSLWALSRNLAGVQLTEHRTRISNHKFMLDGGPCLSVKSDIIRQLISDRPLENLSPIHESRIAKLINLADYIEEHPALFEDSLIVTRYLNIVSSFGILAVEFNRDDDVELATNKLDHFLKIRKEADALIFERIEELKIIQIRNRRDLKNGQATITRIIEGLSRFGERIEHRRRLDFFLAIAEVYLLNGQASSAAKLLAPIVDSVPNFDDPRPNSLLWTYYLIAEYELGHFQILQNWANASTKYFNRHQIGDPVAVPIIAFLRRLSRKSISSKKKAEFDRFRDEILPLLKDPQNAYYEIRFPFEAWVKNQSDQIAT